MYNNLRIIKGTGGLVSWRPCGDHPNDSIADNGQNTGKSPGDLRRLAVTQTPVKDTDVKNSKGVNNNNIYIYIYIYIYEAYVTRTSNSDLGRRTPGSGRVRCREYVPIKKDTLGQVIAQFIMTC